MVFLCKSNDIIQCPYFLIFCWSMTSRHKSLNLTSIHNRVPSLNSSLLKYVPLPISDKCTSWLMAGSIKVSGCTFENLGSVTLKLVDMLENSKKNFEMSLKKGLGPIISISMGCSRNSIKSHNRLRIWSETLIGRFSVNPTPGNNDFIVHQPFYKKFED